MRTRSLLLIVLAVAAMVVLGVVMLYSTSAFARDSHGDPHFFLKKQLLWLGVGTVACILGSRLDYHFWQRTWWIWFVIATLMLIGCFVPHIGKRINGSSRWITLGFTNFQPSELAKFAAVATLAWWFTHFEKRSSTFFLGFIAPLGVIGLLIGLIALEVDIGTSALIGCASLVILFIAGSNLAYLAGCAAIGAGAVAAAIMALPERTGRFLAFLNPEKYPADAYQTVQGLIAFGSGGIDGLGLGNGRQKWSYLPFAHTDFIFPMIGEELGLWFTLGVVICFTVLLVCGTRVVLNARDRFGMLLGFGILSMLALQAIINIGVTTSLLPNKGMPLPFISYGGSNLMMCLFSVGILISIYRHGAHEKAEVPVRKLHARIARRI